MNHFKVSILLILLCALVSCSFQGKTDKHQKVWKTKAYRNKNKKHNTLTEVEKADGWRLLFDGKSLNGWHLYNSPDSSSVWTVEKGMLYCNSKKGSEKQGDLVTDVVFENFELTMEWSISGRGNSGIFINVQEKPELLAPWQSGPEYQILDPTHMDFNIPTKRTGCLYGFTPQKNAAVTYADGQWNRTRIQQYNGKATFYLNGKLTTEINFNSPEWQAMVAKSGFQKFPEFGKAAKGKIALQNWYFDVWFRNIKIREL